MHGTFLPQKFFVTSGSGEDNNSELNAFDRALLRGKITQCNLVSVSSILPPDAEEIEPVYITPGTITFSVLARCMARGAPKPRPMTWTSPPPRFSNWNRCLA